jgi:hypothetical protein
MSSWYRFEMWLKTDMDVTDLDPMAVAEALAPLFPIGTLLDSPTLVGEPPPEAAA